MINKQILNTSQTINQVINRVINRRIAKLSTGKQTRIEKLLTEIEKI